jgi:excisionase family DNA binding protein
MPEASTAGSPAKLGYSPAEAAEISGISRHTIYELIAAGVIPSRRFGRRLVVLHADLAAWLDTLPENRAEP